MPSDLKKLAATAEKLAALKQQFNADFTDCVEHGYFDREIAAALGVTKEAVRLRRGRLGLNKERRSDAA